MKKLSGVVIALLAVGCGIAPTSKKSEKMPNGSVSHEDPFLYDAASESYAYILGDETCSTGLHQFASLKEYCSALQDETLNKGCAADQRKVAFAEQCK